MTQFPKTQDFRIAAGYVELARIERMKNVVIRERKRRKAISAIVERAKEVKDDAAIEFVENMLDNSL